MKVYENMDSKTYGCTNSCKKISLILVNIIQIDASELALSDAKTSSSIALNDQKLFQKCPHSFNSEMDMNIL